jgi:hypothetical protein
MKIPEHLRDEIHFRERAIKMLDPETTPEEREKLSGEIQEPRNHPTKVLAIIADLSRKRLEATAKGDTKSAAQTREEIAESALTLLRRRTVFHHIDSPVSIEDELRSTITHCEEILTALSGADRPRKRSSMTKVLSEVGRFCHEHGRLPTRDELKERGIRGEDISNLPENLKQNGKNAVIKGVKRGRPSK